MQPQEQIFLGNSYFKKIIKNSSCTGNIYFLDNFLIAIFTKIMIYIFFQRISFFKQFKIFNEFQNKIVFL